MTTRNNRRFATLRQRALETGTLLALLLCASVLKAAVLTTALPPR
jgi:hypothetical protein